MNYGYQNERDFVALFNNKFLYELSDHSKSFLKDLFGDTINDTEKIICWKNNSTQKTDIYIRFKKYVKNISIKSGNGNSIHSESVQDFKLYLEKLIIPYNIIDKYISYHYGYKRKDDGSIDFSKVLSADEYKELYQSEIDIFNNYVNKTRIIIDMIDRFLIRGRYSEYEVDALISGTVNDYVWILKDDLYDLILSKKNSKYTSPHIACITIGPKKRNIYSKEESKNDRYIVCARWNFIRDSIDEFKNNRMES